MSDMSAAIGLASASSGLAAAEELGVLLPDERPGHRLDHAARGERALGRAGADLQRGQDRLARRVIARERRRRHMLSTPTMRMTSSTISALPSTSGRHDGAATLTPVSWPATDEAERGRTRRISDRRRRGRPAASLRWTGNR